MQLETALHNYFSTIVGSITDLAPVGALGLFLILVVYGATRRA